MKATILLSLLTCIVHVLIGQSLVTDFGTDGIRTLTTIGPRPEAREIQELDDGRILIYGQIVPDLNDNFQNDIYITRLNSDGGLDFFFAEAGTLIGGSDLDGRNEIRGVIIEEDASMRALVRLVDENTGDDKFALLYLNEIGLRNTEIGVNGLIDYSFLSGDFHLQGLLELSTGELITTGHSGFEGFADLLLVSFEDDGVLNDSFDEDGIKLEDFFSSFDRSQSATVQANDQIVCAGWSFNFATNTTEMIITRFNPDGSLDTDFASGGVFNLETKEVNNRFTDVLIDNEGRIVAAGQFGPEANMDVVVLRMLPNGMLDPSFNFGEPLIVSSGDQDERVDGMGELPGGDFIIGATVENISSNSSDFGLLRITQNGQVNTEFGTNGWYLLDIDEDDELENITVTQEGDVLMVGNIGGAGLDSEIAIVKVNPGILVSTQNYDLEHIRVYPVPSNDGILQINSDDVQSVEVYSSDFAKVLSTDSSSLDLSDHASGVYLLKIRTSKGNTVRRVVLE